MLRPIRFAVLVLAAVAIVLPATSAFAAPSEWKTVDVTMQIEQQQSLLLVSGELPPSAKLPYEGELAVPAGTQLQWIGEILGGAASADPELKYVKSTSQGMDLYRFTLTKSRIAQVEGIVPGMSGPDGANFRSTMKWTAWQALPEVRISHRIPQASQIISAAPGATIQPSGTGFSMYTKTVKNPKAGEVIDLSFTYSSPAAGAAAAGGSASSPGSNPAIFVVILGLVLGGFGLLIYKVRAKIQPDEVPAVKAPRAQASATPAAKSSTPKTTAPKSSAASSSRKRKAEPVAPEPEPQPKKIKPAYLIVVVVGLLVVAGVIAGGQGVSAKVAGGTIKKSFGAASPCTSASIPLMANQGVDLGAQGEKLLDSFIGQEGIGDVVLDLDRSVVDITFCESLQTDESIRQILTGTGLVSTGAAAAPIVSAPTSATIDASGKIQKATVDTSGGSFAPNQIALKAGVPTEIAFGAAASCITEVIFTELGIKQDLTAGPATVKLPALEPGTYAFDCPMGHQEGSLIVQ